jgi:hypothetical protein
MNHFLNGIYTIIKELLPKIAILYLFSIIGVFNIKLYAQSDLSIQINNPSSIALPGDSINLSIIIHNEAATTTRKVEVAITLPAGISYLSHNTELGAYDFNTGIWEIEKIGASTDEIKMTLKVKVSPNTEGMHYVFSEIIAMDEKIYDIDSKPNNRLMQGALFEDDTKLTCITVPAFYEENQPIKMAIYAIEGFEHYEWSKDEVVIPSATKCQYIATSIGSYTYRCWGHPNAPACEGFSGCPLIIAFRHY